MRKAIFFITLIFPLFIYAQTYHWDFGVSGYSCDVTTVVFNDAIYLNSGPKAIETDNEGNCYVFGNFSGTDYHLKQYAFQEKDIQLKYFTPYSVPNWYLYKINKKGEIIWSNRIVADNLPSDVEFYVNPHNGKIYLITNFIRSFYLNENDIIDLYPQPLAITPSRMMLCFDSSGNYNKVITTNGVLGNLVFANAEEGVIKMTDSLNSSNYPSLFRFSCVSNTTSTFIQNMYYNIIGFDKEKQRYINDQFGEYDLNLNKTKSEHYYSQDVVTTNKISSYFKAKDGSMYLCYYSTPGYYQDYNFLIKIDRNFKLIWRLKGGYQIQKDSNDNIWIIGNGKIDRSTNPKSILNKYANYTNNNYINISRLDTATGNIDSNALTPTNYLFYNNIAECILKIDNSNNIWLAGSFRDEIEFGNTILTADCYSNSLPLQHFVAKASTVWKQTRKNLNINETKTEKSVTVFPIPASNTITLKFKNPTIPLNIQIYNSLGQSFQVNYNNDNQTIDIQNLPLGIYTLKINHSQNIESCTFIKN